MQINLTQEESTALEAILVEEVSKLQIEIGRTDTHDFKERLRQKQLLLESVARKVGSLNPLVQST